MTATSFARDTAAVQSEQTVEPDWLWPGDQLHHVLTLLGQRSGLLSQGETIAEPPSSKQQADPQMLGRWLRTVGQSLAIEAESVETTYADLERFLQKSGPLLLPVRGSKRQTRFLALLGGQGKQLTIIAPNGKRRRIPLAQVRAWLTAPLEQSLEQEITATLATLWTGADEEGFQPDESVRQALLQERLGRQRIDGGWLLRFSPAAPIWRQIRWHGLLRPLGVLIGAETMRQVLFAGSWVVLGQSALQGRFEWTMFWLWALLLLSMIPFQGIVGWAEERLTSKGTELLRQRLLSSALRLNPDRLRHAGAGTFLEKVLDVDALEGLTINGGFATLQAGVQIVVAGIVLTLGIGGAIHALLFLLFLLYLLGAGWYHYRSYRQWSDTHRQMTRDLVEQMVGHRTRLAQEPPARRHKEEDAQLNAYLHRVGRVDSSQMLLGGGLSQAWLLIGLGWLAFVALATPVSATALAIGLGGVLLAYQSINQLAGGSGNLIRGLVAWRELKLIVQAEEPSEGKKSRTLGGSSQFSVQTSLDERSQQPNADHTSVEAGLPLLTAHHLSFRYRPDDALVLNKLDFIIQQGERLLLEGPSGGGKSTLGAVLAGIRPPDSGLILLHGYDVESLGLAAWRERIVLVPQFQENFILGGSLAFNLLMGREWPPTEQDMAEAEAVCRSLGLGDLLDRMPARLLQQVGESGWQLSHGERSRIFVARAMLQRADLLILDESFGALDPKNWARRSPMLWMRLPSLLVIAHP